MKKLILICEILIVLVFLTRIALIGEVIKTSDSPEGFLSVSTAAANSATVDSHKTPVKDVLDDGLAEEKKLLSILLEKNKALDARQDYLMDEAIRLNSLKDEILLSIGQLQDLENNLAVTLENIKNTNDQKYKDLAKIYECAPAEWVGAIIEKLDSETAATIIMKMKNKSAGKILGYLSPGKSIEITREITRAAQTP